MTLMGNMVNFTSFLCEVVSSISTRNGQSKLEKLFSFVRTTGRFLEKALFESLGSLGAQSMNLAKLRLKETM